MVRTQIQFRQDQFRAIKRKAAEQDVSMAEFIRRSMDEILARGEGQSRKERMLEALRRIEALHLRSGASDVAERHDYYLGKALEEEHVR